LKMLKRAGWGYDLAGVESTGRGECTVLCPACPQPGKNLPDNWHDAPKGKQCIVSKDSVDPSLGRGWAYFIEEMAYKMYLQTCSSNTQQVSFCCICICNCL
ncbi:hypothetical protein EV702DRAFT_973842, partial [Suillus placidus]